MHTTKTRGFFGGVFDRLSDRSVSYLSKMPVCVLSLVKLRWYRFGNHFLAQKSLIPIGGLVCGSILEVVLSVEEHVLD